MRAVKQDAMIPIGMENLPRFHGPCLKLSPTKATLMNTGVVKATKAAMAPMEKSAPAARLPPKIKSSKMHPIVVLNQTALTGVCVVV